MSGPTPEPLCTLVPGQVLAADVHLFAVLGQRDQVVATIGLPLCQLVRQERCLQLSQSGVFEHGRLAVGHQRLADRNGGQCPLGITPLLALVTR
ncbi:hypothetical protein D3C81_2045590 [compost metagenome]